ncbi:type II toxin-antitoxin system VapC family toxin [Candidatus Gottesmanbacteria bacterium]|nr:type II toxin-antitoxin system VapC family toxin [Candidatus Gottesmanbacteria bacterium]
MKTIFLDSSVLFSAINSPTGGSAKLFVTKGIKLVSSKVVLTEVERNVRKKLASYQLERMFLLFGQFTILPQRPNKALIRKAKAIIVEKDAVILAEAKQAKIDILATLDKKHFLTKAAQAFLQPQKILTPKMILDRR